MQRLDLAFQALDLEVPEVRGPSEHAEAYVRRVATEKANAGLALVRARDPDAVVLGSDTEVVLDDRVFGKPADRADAIAMLSALSGRRHQVITVVALTSPHRETAWETVVSEVSFADLPAAHIAAYADTGEPMGKAGAYAIQGQAERFITHLAGSYSGVMGLPLYQTSQLLARFGVL